MRAGVCWFGVSHFLSLGMGAKIICEFLFLSRERLVGSCSPFSVGWMSEHLASWMSKYENFNAR